MAVQAEHTFAAPALVIALYLHPDDHDTNEITKESVLKIILDFNSAHATVPSIVICGGDFNLDKDEIIKRTNEGDELLRLLSGMYWSSDHPTSTRSDRCIDWLFTTVKQ